MSLKYEPSSEPLHVSEIGIPNEVGLGWQEAAEGPEGDLLQHQGVDQVQARNFSHVSSGGGDMSSASHENESRKSWIWSNAEGWWQKAAQGPEGHLLQHQIRPQEARRQVVTLSSLDLNLLN